MRILSSAIAVGIAAILAAAFIVRAENRGAGTVMNDTVRITVGTKEFAATLENNAAAAAFRKKLPLTVSMNELNSNEKYCEWPEKLPVNAAAPGRIRSGDLMLYGSSTIVLFYEDFTSPYSYTQLGRINDPAGLKVALGKGNPEVTFAAVPNQTGKHVAADGAVMQQENPAMPTRVLREGTRINMQFGDTVIPGILNDSETAKALIARLPYTVRMNRYSHDFCGVMQEPLPYQEENVHYGWLNGDIDFARDANYFTILFEDEKNSEPYGHQVNIGVIDVELSRISRLRGSYDVRIELAK